jgi:hypothetical protein
MNVTPFRSEKMSIDLAGACGIYFDRQVNFADFDLGMSGSGNLKTGEESIGEANADDIAGFVEFVAQLYKIRKFAN